VCFKEELNPYPPDKTMAISQLTSRENALFKTIRLISSGSRRAPAELVVAEGIRVLQEIEKCGCPIDAVLLSEGFGNSSKEEALLDGWLARNVRICRTSESLFRSVSDVRAPQGAIALVRFPERKLDAAAPGQNALVLFACGIQDPGNLGTIIRTAAAAGASLVCMGPKTVSPRNPKAIRASAGAIFRIPIVEHAEMSQFLDYCACHSIRAYRTDILQGLAYTHVDLRSPSAILLGNEGNGITNEECIELPAIRIPMAEDVESLNVAMAGAIILFEASRQRMKG
jgi:RNA methyltransferase, TrmH family